MTAVIMIASCIYAGLMFLIARWGDRTNNPLSQKVTHHPFIYAFALGIYCTSWTYFGAVGTASTDGWQFLPIILGPILLFLFGYPILEKLVRVSKKQNVTSIADFISSRYGKRQQTGLIVTVIATLAIIPYIALQLKAINASFSALTLDNDFAGGMESNSAFIATLFIALFAILYGARKADVTEYRSGLIFAIAFESLFKLLGLVISASIALTLFYDIDITTLPPMPEEIWSLERFSTTDFIVQTFMAAAAILCLPRQFHVMVVDNSDSQNLHTARWLFSLYLILTAITIIPIAMAGHYFLLDTGVNKDIYTMQLPIFVKNDWATLFVFLGGISAASAMIIVATLTLSTMITNDVFMPLLLKRDSRQILAQNTSSFYVVRLRQFTIGAILLLSYAYYLSWANQGTLHSIGLIAFSLVIQLLPPIIGGLYWRKGHANGVYAGLLLGFMSWMMFLLMPLASANLDDHSGIISQGVIISLIVNSAAYYVFSMMAKERLIDKIQAAAFVHPNVKVPIARQRLVHTSASVKDLTDLLLTFLGNGRCDQLLLEYEQDQEALAKKEGTISLKLKDTEQLTHHFVEYCERMLGGVLGASSAQSLVNIVLSGKQLGVEDVVNFFDDTTMALKTNQAILFSSLENLSQGISVIDKHLNLVAWNKQYLELFDYPESMVKVGLPIKNLIEFNALRGECGHGEIEELVNKRLSHLQSSQKHSFIRRRGDGRVIEMNGNPLPNGGFVTSFNDITSFVETEQALKDANINLEDKVKRRVDQISEITQELQFAKQEAEQANASKTRFLALASHDVLQPLNAARLYLSSLSEDSLTQNQYQTLDKVDQSLYAMEDILATLLEISKLEQGGLVPTFSHFKLSSVLRPLCDEIAAQCKQKNIQFVEHWQDVVVYCDATYLRRILQNFLSNAVKYTQEGKVLIGLRYSHRKGNEKESIRIEVWDTGEGISESDHEHVFQDFYRTHTGSVKGLGLGLGVVGRMSEQLKSPIKLTSKFGQGSCFGVSIKLGDSRQVIETSQFAQYESSQFNKLNVICVDDELQNLDALKSLLDKWNCQCLCFSSVEQLSEYLQLPECICPDVLLIDYQLVPSTTSGLELIQQVRSHWQVDIPAALVTAVKDESLKEMCKDLEVRYMPKPLKPAALKSWLKSLVQKA